MGVDDAIKAAEFVRCHEILGLHYNTFPPIRIDTIAAIEKFKAARQRLHLLLPGETTLSRELTMGDRFGR